VSRGFKVLLINSSEELTFRDFKKADSLTPTTKVHTEFREPGKAIGPIHDGITYLPYECLGPAKISLSGDDLINVVVIADEFDSILFNSKHDINEVTALLRSFPRLLGLTGSDLRDYHMKLIEACIAGRVVRIRGPSIAHQDVICHGVEVFDKISDFREVTTTLCQQ